MPDIVESFPVLETERLELVEITEAHASDLLRLFNDGRVTEYYHVYPIKNEADALKVLSMLTLRYTDGVAIRWGIVLKRTINLIGVIGFQNIVKGHKASVVYALMPDYWRKGIITEALLPVLRFGFGQLGLRRIDAEVLHGNIASMKLLEATGFRHEGLLSCWLNWNGAFYDAHIYAIVAPW